MYSLLLFIVCANDIALYVLLLCTSQFSFALSMNLFCIFFQLFIFIPIETNSKCKIALAVFIFHMQTYKKLTAAAIWQHCKI